MRTGFCKVILCLLLLAPYGAMHAATRPLQVVASFSILGDMLRNVGGDAVEVSTLVGPDSDAHVFEPSPADARRVAKADLIFVNGLHFEGWLDRLIKASGYRGKIVRATTSIAPRVLGGEPDPHAWQSLANGRIYVENIRAALVAALPAEAAAINARAAAYWTQLDAADRDLKAKISRVAPERRRVITSHDAFGYFGAAYGIEFLAPQGRSTDSEASAADVSRMIQQIKTRRVQALFVENITDPRLIARIAKEAGGVVGGKLYSDALSAPGGPADTYLKMFEHNTTALVAAMLAVPPTPTP